MPKNQQIRDILDRLTLENMTDEQEKALFRLVSIDPVNHTAFSNGILQYQSILNGGNKFIDDNESTAFLLPMGEGEEEAKRLNNCHALHALVTRKCILLALDKFPYPVLQGIAGDINAKDHLIEKCSFVDKTWWEDADKVKEACKEAQNLLKPEQAERHLKKLEEDTEALTKALKETITFRQLQHIENNLLARMAHHYDIVTRLGAENAQVEKAGTMVQNAKKQLQEAKQKQQPKLLGNFYILNEIQKSTAYWPTIIEDIVTADENVLKNLPTHAVEAKFTQYKSVRISNQQCVRSTLHFPRNNNTKATCVLLKQEGKVGCDWVENKNPLNDRESTIAALIMAKDLLLQYRPKYNNCIIIRGKSAALAAKLHAALLLLVSSDKKQFLDVEIACLVKGVEQPMIPNALLKTFGMAPDPEKRFIQDHIQIDSATIKKTKEELQALRAQHTVEEGQVFSFGK